jgi:uncharacterized protein YkwD
MNRGRCGLIAGLALALVISAGPGALPAQASPGYRAYAEKLVANPPVGAKARPDLEAYIAELTNQYRRSQNRAPLKPVKDATIAARAQALDMLKGNYVGHQSASGYRFGQRVEAFVGETEVASENAARDRLPGEADKRKAARLFKQWVDSTGHRRNMLSRDPDEMSVGVIQAGNHLYAVQIFWKKRATEGGLSAFRSW